MGDVVNNGGVIRPGGQGNVGTLTINGNYTQLAGGDLTIEIASNGGGISTPGVHNDYLVVNGNADVQGTLRLLDIAGYTVSNGDSFTVVTVTGAPTGQFDSVVSIGGSIASETYGIPDLDITLNFSGLFSWTGNGDGSTWNDPANWDLGVPGIGNDVSIGVFDVTIASAANANTLSLASGGTLSLTTGTLTIASDSTLDGLLTVAGSVFDIGVASVTLAGGLDWTGGSIIKGNGGVLNLPATNTLSGAASRALLGVTANISGPTTYSAGFLDLGESNGVDAVINNSGVFDFAGDVSIGDLTDGGAPGFNNLDGGTLVKSAGTGLSFISTAVNTNEGSVIVQSGRLDPSVAIWTLGAGDVFSGNGTYVGDVVNNGGVIRPGGQGNVGTLTIRGDFTNSLGALEIDISSAAVFDVLAVGQIDVTANNGIFSGGSIDVNLLNYVPDVSDLQAVVTCTLGCSGSFGTINSIGGVVYGEITNATSLSLDVLSVSFFWDGGGPNDSWFDPLNWSLDVLPGIGTDVVLGSGDNILFDDIQGITSTVASLTMNTGSSLNLAIGTLTNAGLLTVNGGASVSVNGGNLVNNGSAVIAGSYALNSGGSSFASPLTVSGVFRQGGGIATTTGIALNAGGNMNLAGGTLTNNGPLAVNSGASMSVGGANFINNGTASIAGSYLQTAGNAGFNLATTVSGSFSQSNGVASFNSATSFPGAFNLSGGLVNLFAAASLQNLNNNWTGGTISGDATLMLGSVPGDTTLAISGAGIKVLDTILLDMNRNDINMSGNGGLLLTQGATTGNSAAVFHIPLAKPRAGVVNHSGNGSIAGDGSGSFINNGGTFNKGAGAGTIAVDLVNDAASVVNVAGGALIIDDAAASDAATYNVSSTGGLVFAQNRNLTGTLNNAGGVVAGLGTTPIALALPANLNNSGSLVLNNAVVDLAALNNNTLVMSSGTTLSGSGTVQGNVNNVAGVVIIGGTGSLGSLLITGTYTQGADSAVVVEVLNDGANTISDRLTVNGPATLNGGTLLIGYVTSSLGLVTSDFQPLNFEGGVSGGFARVYDAGGTILFGNFNGGVFTVLGVTPDIPDAVIDDLIAFLESSDDINDVIASNVSTAEAIMEELLEEEAEQGSLVCN